MLFYQRRRCKPIVAVLYVWLILPSVVIANGVETLISELQHPSWTVRRDAAKQLGTLQWGDLPPDNVVIEALAAALVDKETIVRQAAATALGRLSTVSDRIVPLLIKALTDRATGVRETAAKALGQLGAEAKEAVPALTKVFTNHSENSSLRTIAIEALGCMGPAASAAIPQLIAEVTDYRNRSALRIAAAEALGSMGPSASCAAPVLSQILADYSNSSALRHAAATALGYVGSSNQDAVHVLVDTLSDPDAEVREAAAGALGELSVEEASAASELPSLDLTVLRLLGTTIVPLRTLAEWLGAAVAFDPVARTVTIRARLRNIVLRIKSATALVDGRDVSLPVPVFVFEDTTMVPLRFLAECCGTAVDWYANTQEIVLSADARKTRVKVPPTLPETETLLLEAAGLIDPVIPRK